MWAECGDNGCSFPQKVQCLERSKEKRFCGLFVMKCFCLSEWKSKELCCSEVIGVKERVCRSGSDTYCYSKQSISFSTFLYKITTCKSIQKAVT